MPQTTLFYTLVVQPPQAARARLLVESLRAFGGPLRDSPVRVLYAEPAAIDPGDWRNMGDLQPLPLGEIRAPRFWFSRKVHAGARAEALARSAPEVRSLVWLAPESLVLAPPLGFDLCAPGDAAAPGTASSGTPAAALRTVHHSNVGSRADGPLDAYWAAVYASAGLAEAPYTTRSYVDGRELRPYWNTHCFAVNPRLGLLQAWRERFLALVDDAAFQAGPCQDTLHQVFLHQAVLCALLAKALDQAQIRALPPAYSYPLHMHAQVPPADRARALNDLVCPVYEDELPLEGLAVHEPLRSWLEARATA